MSRDSDTETGAEAVEAPAVTVGIDLAGYSGTTGVCRVTWAERPVVEVLDGGDDEDLLAAVRSAGKTGLDSPIGWPVAFASLLAAHQAGRKLPVPSRYLPHASGRQGLGRFTHRLTDDVAWKRTGAGRRRPLSVATDRLGVVAIRAVSLLERLAESGLAVPLDGSGAVAEVYPAHALLRWGLAGEDSYKGPKPTALAARTRILAGLTEELGLDLTEHARDRCTRSDHDLDALVAAVVARAVACGMTHGPDTEEESALAAVEGWMHIPRPEASLRAVRDGARAL
ncbi:DUF429 domain-containing protein [Actinacidiphila acidipaludis]|uniref:DUF429 domain-containing protein n=1 Tax=Actinacidiphila acidipaludis TaxID=2873382 RepID=A0ABS7Q728_9ACTN|nr:DUF429 domain-containing protein [Streptomyces acidipaludis]MBY8878975.1 DUF429 domain-containing protein [Streptomyces acidipaludis]